MIVVSALCSPPFFHLRSYTGLISVKLPPRSLKRDNEAWLRSVCLCVLSYHELYTNTYLCRGFVGLAIRLDAMMLPTESEAGRVHLCTLWAEAHLDVEMAWRGPDPSSESTLHPLLLLPRRGPLPLGCLVNPEATLLSPLRHTTTALSPVPFPDVTPGSRRCNPCPYWPLSTQSCKVSARIDINPFGQSLRLLILSRDHISLVFIRDLQSARSPVQRYLCLELLSDKAPFHRCLKYRPQAPFLSWLIHCASRRTTRLVS
jgi:hypothetical protein